MNNILINWSRDMLISARSVNLPKLLDHILVSCSTCHSVAFAVGVAAWTFFHHLSIMFLH